MNSNCSILLDMRNLQEQVKRAFCYQKLFWPFTVWINCSRDLKNFANCLQPQISKVFLITRTIFSHSRTEQFWYQNTISWEKTLHTKLFFTFFMTKISLKLLVSSNFTIAPPGLQHNGMTVLICARLNLARNIGFFKTLKYVIWSY